MYVYKYMYIQTYLENTFVQVIVGNCQILRSMVALPVVSNEKEMTSLCSPLYMMESTAHICACMST